MQQEGSLEKFLQGVLTPEQIEALDNVPLNFLDDLRNYDEKLEQENKSYALEQAVNDGGISEAKEWNDYSFLSKAFIKALSFVEGWEIDKSTTLEKLQNIVIQAHDYIIENEIGHNVNDRLMAYDEILQRTGLDATFSKYEIFKFVEDDYHYSCDNHQLIPS